MTRVGKELKILLGTVPSVTLENKEKKAKTDDGEYSRRLKINY